MNCVSIIENMAPIEGSIVLVAPGVPPRTAASGAAANDAGVVAGQGAGGGRNAPGAGLTRAESPTNLAEVRQYLDGLPRTRRIAAMRTAVSSFGRLVGKPLAEIPADPVILSALMAQAIPASAGLTKERCTRIYSELRGALREVGIAVMPGRDTAGLAPAWAEFAASLPDRGARTALSRLMSWFTREGVGPGEVTPEHFERFRDTLQNASLHRDPLRAFRAAVRAWNAAASDGAAWPVAQIALPGDARRYSLEWEAFPDSFGRDVWAFLSQKQSPDPLSEDYYPAVRASTVAARHGQIRQMASTLIASGFAMEDLTSLAVLVRPANAKKALRVLLDRRGGERGVHLAAQAQLLVTIARYWIKASPEDIQTLQNFAVGLRVKSTGMTEKNRARLRQFDLTENVRALLTLPQKVLKAVRRKDDGSEKAARRVMLAAAVEVLLMAPMRVRNLAELEIDRHLLKTRRGGREILHIAIPGQNTKNGVPVEMQLPADTCALLGAYLKIYRSRLVRKPSPYLFPGLAAESRNEISLARAISSFVHHECGIVMNVHMFRHLAGKLHLDLHPNEMETVRLLLGHKSSTTTERSYVHVRTDGAFRRYDATIARLRDDHPGAGASSDTRGAK